MINEFIGEYRFLSNFYPCLIEFDGQEYPSVEHAYQAAKTLNLVLRKPFQENIVTAARSKRMGQKLLLRKDWEEVKVKTMNDIVQFKFNNLSLRKRLLETNTEELIEGNYWHDNFWGSCTCGRCKNQGQNNLGKILMNIRNNRV